MSALDFGAGSASNSTRYYTFTWPALPNGDWCVGCWINYTTGAPAIGHSVIPWSSPLDPSANAGVAAYVDAFSTPSGQASIYASGNGGTPTSGPFTGTTRGVVNEPILWIVQRRGTSKEWYWVPKGAVVTAPTATGTFTGTTIATGTGRIGAWPTATTFNWCGPLGEFFIFDNRSLSAGEVSTMAFGRRPPTLPLVLLPFRSGGVATETNIGSGGSTYDATQVGSGYTTVADFFSLQEVYEFESTQFVKRAEITDDRDDLSASSEFDVSLDAASWFDEDFFSSGGTSNGVGSAAGTCTVSAVGASTVSQPGSAAGTCTVTAVGASTVASAASASGIGAATGVGTSVFSAVGSTSGSGTATAVGAAVTVGTASASGTGTATGVGRSTAAGAASASGSGVAAAVGALTADKYVNDALIGQAMQPAMWLALFGPWSADGTASGTSTVTAVGRATVARAGAAAGTSTVSAVGASVVSAVGSASGTGTASGASSSSSSSPASAAGTCAVTAVGVALRLATGSATGTGAATGVGRSTAAAVGSTSGAGAATGVGRSTAAAVGSTSGVGTASGITAVIANAVAAAAGTSTVAAVGFGATNTDTPAEISISVPADENVIYVAADFHTVAVYKDESYPVETEALSDSV